MAKTRSTSKGPKKRTRRDAEPTLTSLLAALTGGTETKGPPSPSADGDDVASTDESTLALFASHVGKSPEIVVRNALRHAKNELERELDILDKKQSAASTMCLGDERDVYYNHPQNRGIHGPRPDAKVWMKLFVGEERAAELLADAKPLDDDGGGGGKEATEGVALATFETEAPRLPPEGLLTNILRYVRKEADRVPLRDLLRFSILYGLDGVMNDILAGRYGGKAGGLTVNALLPLDDTPLPDRPSLRSHLFFPAYALGAILGHANVVLAALSHPTANFDASVGYQSSYQTERGEGMKVCDHNHDLPSDVFFWVFMKNMPDMIKCLVNDCGFQFRWITHDDHLPIMFHRIFDLEEYESSPKWRGDVDAEDLMWENKRDRCKLRAASAYKEQMKMLDLLISLGFPFSLFFPTEPPVEREEKLRKEKKLETRQEWKAYMRNMNRQERRAREKAEMACGAYNSFQNTERETLTLGDFYRKLKSRWEGKEVQVDKLPEFEALDSRWRAMQQERNGDDDSQSYYDSDDGSSYGSPPGMEICY